LTGQFLLRDFSMFKVMFGAIVLAAAIVLVAIASGLPSPPQALIPSLNLAVLAGGCLLGAGLVVGGYCPGTALAGAAGGRVDALLFLLMMYPGYRFWVWLEPRLALDWHAPLAPSLLTLPDLFGMAEWPTLAVIGVACALGWMIGSRFEARSAATDTVGSA
jgi:hypothetical protein